MTAKQITDLSTQSNVETSKRRPRDKWRRRVWELVIFAMLGALMFCSKVIMEFLPNVHLLGMLTITYTLVFRTKALIPIYINVILVGLYGGFNLWWFPYLYMWTILWGITMLLPKKMPKWLCCIIFPILCSLHGFAYGTLYAPAQALMFHLNFDQMIAWIISGFPFDIIHGIGNFVAGLLIVPMTELLRKLTKKQSI